MKYLRKFFTGAVVASACFNVNAHSHKATVLEMVGGTIVNVCDIAYIEDVSFQKSNLRVKIQFSGEKDIYVIALPGKTLEELFMQLSEAAKRCTSPNFEH